MSEIVIPYTKREQFKNYHARTQQFAVLVARRRGGKSVAAVNDLLKRALKNKRIFPQPRYAFIGPLFKQTRRNIWGYLKYYAGFVPGARINESNFEVTLPGGQLVYIDGADNPDAIRGGYLDGVILDEFQDMKPIALDTVILPMLGDYDGWLTITGTAKGKNQLYQIIYGDEEEEIEGAIGDPEWFCEILPFSGSTWSDADKVMRIKRKMSVNKFKQEYECSFDVPIEGSIYGKLMEQAKERIVPIPYNPAYPVITIWDLGYSDTLSIGFAQLVGKEPRVIDYYENSLEAIDHYVKVIKDKPYNYETHVLPHDAGHKSLRTGTTLSKQLENMGIKNIVLPQDSIASGIELVRQLIPQLWFEEKKTKLLIKALTEYQYEWDDEKKVYTDKPLHNWASHPSDMMRYFATWLARRKSPPVAQQTQQSYSSLQPGSWMG
jgi:hypothetical protein